MKIIPFKKTRGCCRGFTLVEMLVVVLIIAILIGISVKIIGAFKDQNEKAVTKKRIQQLKAAIEAFYSEYGHYPPVVRDRVFDGDPAYTWQENYKDLVNYEIPDEWTIDKAGNITETYQRPFFYIGLLGYLMPRWSSGDWYNLDHVKTKLSGQDAFSCKQWKDYNVDFYGNALTTNSTHDVQAKERWMPFISDIIDPDNFGDVKAGGEYLNRKSVRSIYGQNGKTQYFLKVFTVRDGWGDSFYYRSDPPHMTYKLWSKHGVEVGDTGF